MASSRSVDCHRLHRPLLFCCYGRRLRELPRPAPSSPPTPVAGSTFQTSTVLAKRWFVSPSFSGIASRNSDLIDPSRTLLPSLDSDRGRYLRRAVAEGFPRGGRRRSFCSPSASSSIPVSSTGLGSYSQETSRVVFAEPRAPRWLSPAASQSPSSSSNGLGAKAEATPRSCQRSPSPVVRGAVARASAGSRWTEVSLERHPSLHLSSEASETFPAARSARLPALCHASPEGSQGSELGSILLSTFTESEIYVESSVLSDSRFPEPCHDNRT